MNSTDFTQHTRPFGYWLKAVDRLMADEFARAFAAEGITRGEWRHLNAVAGNVPIRRPLTAERLQRLIRLGWVEKSAREWTLTSAGTVALARLTPIVDGIRAKVIDAVPEEELAITLRTLEQIATAFGWEEGRPLPRRRGRGHGRGRLDERGHRAHHPRFDDHRLADQEQNMRQSALRDDHGRAWGHGAHQPHHPHGRRHGAARSRAAFERGFIAGFTRGNDSA